MRDLITNEKFIPCDNCQRAYIGDTVCVERSTDSSGSIERVHGKIIAISDVSEVFAIAADDGRDLQYDALELRNVMLLEHEKTVDDYKKQLMDAQAKVEELQKKIETYDRYKQYDEMADELAAMKNAYIQAGFTKEEAFQLLTETMRAAATMVKKR